MFKTFYYFQQNILKDYTAQLHFNLFPTFSNPYVSEQLVTVAKAGFLEFEGSDTALMYVIYVLILLWSYVQWTNYKLLGTRTLLMWHANVLKLGIYDVFFFENRTIK